MSFTVIDADRVEQQLSMATCIDLMAHVQAAISAGRIDVPLRTFNRVAQGAGFFGLMPGELPEAGVFGAKLISVFPANPAKNDLPAIQGYILLFDRASGTPTALVDAATVTAIRTAAASGAATRILAREDASILALLGYGVQARSHLAAMQAVRDIREVRVWGPSMQKAARFADNESTGHLDIHAVETPDEAVSGADLVCAVSNAVEPILHGAHLAPGSHVNLVGAATPTTREADADVLKRGRVFTEITEFALAEAGDLMMPIKSGAYSEQDIAGEIGAVFNGEIDGRQHAHQITVYKSLGNPAQDLAAANYLVQSGNGS